MTETLTIDHLARYATARLEEARPQVAHWARQVAFWQQVADLTRDPADTPPPQPEAWGGRIKRRQELAREYLRQFGAAPSARLIADWITGQGYPTRSDKLRQYLWAAPGIAFDESKGGWHLTAAAAPGSTPAVSEGGTTGDRG
ncbi:MAG: hypothetical protein C0501_31630 [Isosphaera sp.]|nr:hypothetical protein [Isosphaera sp.]